MVVEIVISVFCLGSMVVLRLFRAWMMAKELRMQEAARAVVKAYGSKAESQIINFPTSTLGLTSKDYALAVAARCDLARRQIAAEGDWDVSIDKG